MCAQFVSSFCYMHKTKYVHIVTWLAKLVYGCLNFEQIKVL